MVGTGSMTGSLRAYKILRAGFIALPIIAGIDKFTHRLVDWTMYLSPMVSQMINPNLFMNIVGVIEVSAGLLVIIQPRIAGYVIALWLWCIIINLLTIPGFFDIALRDFGLSLGALALANLADEHSSA
jgi:hypothetical protein